MGMPLARDDKLLAPAEVLRLLDQEVTVEEKLDGANLGFSILDTGDLRVQNRGQYLFAPYTGQFTRLNGWLSEHQAELKCQLRPELIVFGEWCAARHSVQYQELPDWFMVFDVYDRIRQQFWSVTRRNEWAHRLDLTVPPVVLKRKISTQELTALVPNLHSRYADAFAEGVVIRRDVGDWLVLKAKLVRSGFTQTIAEHWRSRHLVWNKIVSHQPA